MSTSVMTPTNEPPPDPTFLDRPLQLRDSVSLHTGPDHAPYILDDRNGKVVRLHGPARQLLPALDGRYDFRELCAAVGVSPFPGDARSAALIRFVGGLDEADLFVRPDDDVEPSPGRRSRRRRLSFEHTPTDMPPGWRARLALDGARNRLVQPLNRARKWTVVAVVALAFVLHYSIMRAMAPKLSEGVVPDVGGWSMAIVVALVLTQLFLHESAHAGVMRWLGLPPTEIGIRFWFYVLPVPFVSQSAEMLLPQRTQRAAIALAGITSDACTGFLIWSVLEGGGWDDLAYRWAVIHITVLFINLNPFLPTDGSRLVDALTREVSLRTRSVRAAKARVLRRPVPPGSPTNWFKRSYGWVCLLFVAVLLLSLLGQVVVLALGLAGRLL